MADGIGKQQSMFATMIGLWQRLPVVARALVVGFLVAEIGIGAWLAVAALIPAPWSLVLMSAFLWAYWRYSSGPSSF